MVQSLLAALDAALLHMAFRKSSDSRPQISEVTPVAAIPGGEFQVRGKGFAGGGRPTVRFGETQAPLVVGSDSYLIVRVPQGVAGNDLTVGQDGQISAPQSLPIGAEIADGLHPV